MRTPAYSDQRLVADLARAAAELGEPLTVTAYDAWQRGREVASPALLVRRFGSWREACARAGVTANSTRSSTRRWSEGDVIAAVARYLAAAESTGSFADYSAWAATQPSAPSGALLRQRHSWSDIKRRAQDASG